MIDFKTYLIEAKAPESDKISTINSLPLKNGHVGTEMAADMLDGVYNKLLGKPSKIKTEVQIPGIPIGFGYDNKTGQFAIQHNGIINFTFEDIDNNYSDEGLKDKLKAAATHLPKVTPTTKGFFTGKLVDMPEHKTPVSVMVTHNTNGKPLTNSQKSKFVDNPNVSYVNPEIKADPSKFTPDGIKAYKEHMSNAIKAYNKIDPEVWDFINKGHHGQLERYVGSSDAPDINGYIDHLTQTYGGKVVRSQQKGNVIKAENNNKRYSELMTHIADNKKHYSDVIEFLNHIKNAGNILANAAYSSGNKNHILLMHGDNKALLKVPTQLGEEVTTTSSIASTADVRGLGYVTGNPGGVIQNYTAKNEVDTDQRNNILFQMFKDHHFKHHKGKK